MVNRCTRQDWRWAGFIAILAFATAGGLLGCTTDFVGPGEAICGDGTCAESEHAGECPEDCPGTCGDGYCTHAEDPADCAQDCFALCGDSTCTVSENAGMCPQDCPPVCGDGVCTHTEDIVDCAADCSAVCGDGLCAETEGPASCAADCPAVCGDGYVTHTEGCDDGNSDDGDGCSAECQPDPSETACDNGIDDDGDGHVDCDDFDCTNTQACALGDTCAVVWTCVQDCGTDQTCQTGCLSSACVSAAAVFDDLLVCLATSCSSECSALPGGSSCLGCLNVNCAAVLDACALNSCP